MKITVTHMTPPADRNSLRPLREVGTMEKTQFWDLDEIYEALRTARRLGVDPSQLFSSPEMDEVPAAA